MPQGYPNDKYRKFQSAIREAAALEYLRSNKSCKEVADQIGAHEETVRRWSCDLKKKILKDYSQHTTFQELQEKYKLTEKELIKILEL